MTWRLHLSDSNVAYIDGVSPGRSAGDELRSPLDAYSNAVRRGDLSATDLRRFACDCAERALGHLTGLAERPRLLGALGVARQHVGGSASALELDEARNETLQVLYAHEGHPRLQAAVSALQSTLSPPIPPAFPSAELKELARQAAARTARTVARLASRASQNPEGEWSWQLWRLATYLRRHEEPARSRDGAGSKCQPEALEAPGQSVWSSGGAGSKCQPEALEASPPQAGSSAASARPGRQEAAADVEAMSLARRDHATGVSNVEPESAALLRRDGFFWGSRPAEGGCPSASVEAHAQAAPLGGASEEAAVDEGAASEPAPAAPGGRCGPGGHELGTDGVWPVGAPHPGARTKVPVTSEGGEAKGVPTGAESVERESVERESVAEEPAEREVAAEGAAAEEELAPLRLVVPQPLRIRLRSATSAVPAQSEPAVVVEAPAGPQGDVFAAGSVARGAAVTATPFVAMAVVALVSHAPVERLLGLLILVLAVAGLVYAFSERGRPGRGRRGAGRGEPARLLRGFLRKQQAVVGRCAYCFDDADQEPVRTCSGCAALLHADCVVEAEGCTTLGCAQAPRRRRRGAA
jgi:hypothetical protein